MAVTQATYALTGTWTAVQLADVWKQMFIDAGLMTDWYDSVSNGGYEHRILRLTNDSQKTYGYQFIWFNFLIWNGGGYMTIQFTTGWNASTHVPTGTQYYDYVTTPPSNNNTNFFTAQTWTTTQSYEFVRYTSGTTHYFGGAGNLLIKANCGTVPAWLDLNKAAVFTVFQLNTASQTGAGGWRSMYFSLPYQIRRMLFVGRPFAGTYAQRFITSSYVYNGVNTVSDANDPSGGDTNWAGSFRLPSFSTTVNPAYSSNYSPIVTGIDVLPLLDCKLPDDFGFTTTLGTVPAQRDLIYVTPGSEVWEVAQVVASGGTDGMCFLARTT